MDDDYKKYLKSEKWRSIRESLFLSRGKKCEKCSSTNDLQIHHKHYRNIFNELPQDLMIVCKKCHCAIHNIEPSTGKKIKVSRRKKKKKKMTSREKKLQKVLGQIEANRNFLKRTYH